MTEGQENVKATVAHTENRVSTDITALRQERDGRMTEVNHSSQHLTSDTNNDNWNIEMKIKEKYSALEESMDDLQKRNETIDKQLRESHTKEEYGYHDDD